MKAGTLLSTHITKTSTTWFHFRFQGGETEGGLGLLLLLLFLLLLHNLKHHRRVCVSAFIEKLLKRACE